MHKLQLFVTKLHLRFIGARYKETREISLTGEDKLEAVIFTSGKCKLLGQTTLVNTVIINDVAFRSDTLRQVVATHENAHRKQWYKYLIILLLIALACFMFIYLCRQEFAPVPSAGMLVVLLVVACLSSWFLEYEANCETLRKLGVEQVSSAYNVFFAGLTRMERIEHLLSHPPISFCVRICRYFNRNLR
jgi:MFS superfamily sulfate permease-like transporter